MLTCLHKTQPCEQHVKFESSLWKKEILVEGWPGFIGFIIGMQQIVQAVADTPEMVDNLIRL